MIYLDDHIQDFDLQQALSEVSPQRRQYALRYRQERDQRLCVAAYRLLRHALLSHCHEAVACAVSDKPVGIDIETINHYSEEIATHVMSEAEMRQILTSPLPAEAFTRLWTMKESLYKLTGDDNNGDIRHMLDRMPPVTFETKVLPSYVCTVCRYKAVTS